MHIASASLAQSASLLDERPRAAKINSNAFVAPLGRSCARRPSRQAGESGVCPCVCARVRVYRLVSQLVAKRRRNGPM